MQLDDDFLPIFINECQDLLTEMEAALLRLEAEAQDHAAIDAIFRAAHTIKGSAGIFGFERLIDFTHHMESVLDRLRNDQLAVDANLISLLLRCRDQIGAEVAAIAQSHALQAEYVRQGAELTAQLEGLLAQSKSGRKSRAAQANDADVNDDGNDAADEQIPVWRIYLSFGLDTLRNGFDPASFIRYLGKQGEITQLITHLERLPAAAEMDPESCYLDFTIDLQSSAGKEAIENTFEFVRDECQLRILPSPSAALLAIARLERMEDALDRLGELLQQADVLTAAELEQALTLQSQYAQAAEKPLLGKVLVEAQMVPPPVVEAALEKQQQTRLHQAQELQFIRVNAQKLDQLINLVGELVIANAAAHQLSQQTGGGALRESLSLMSQLIEEVRSYSLQLRMVPIGDTFNRFRRIVRDISKELDKQIKLEIQGEETELDKSVVEKISDPLVHLIRNAIDHGIEPTEVRLAAGKPAQGTIRLQAYHEAGNVVIDIADDGGGLNRNKILTKAQEWGLLEEAENLPDAKVWKMIFQPGFSTASQVTNLSGRGVGMDVVKRNIEQLRGTIDIDSQPGLGTTFRIRLPLTLAIINGFLMTVGENHFVVPLDMVLECLELTEAAKTSCRDYLNLRGEVLPLLRLSEYFAINAKVPVKRQNVVVVTVEGRKMGLVVDGLKGGLQAVIKPLATMFGLVRGLAGSTLLGTGEVALVLDVPTLLNEVVQRERVA